MVVKHVKLPTLFGGKMKYCIFSLIFLTSIIPLVLFVHAQEDIKELSRQNEVLRYEISQAEKEIRLLKTDMQILEEKLNDGYGR